MASLGRGKSLVISLDKHLADLSVAQMKIRKQAPELLKKAVTSFRSKTAVLKTRLIILASLRRRAALVSAVSRGIHAMVSSSDGRRASSNSKQARMDCYDRAHMLCKAMAEDKEAASLCPGQGAVVAELSEMAVFHEDGHVVIDWTQSLFDDDYSCYVADEDVEDDDDDCDLDKLDDEPSVIEVIRSSREVQGLEFNADEEIDEACDMFIRRFRSRMNRSF